MTGQQITKKDPIRQVAKQAVLGLGFLMSAAGFAKTLLMAMADPKSGITESSLSKLNADLGWDKQSKSDGVNWVIKKARCSRTVATTAYKVHELFNRAHPDFAATGTWLVSCAKAVADARLFETAKEAIDKLYNSTRAPSRSMIDVSIDTDHTAKRPSIRVTCGQWVPTLCWREPAMRQVDFGDDPTSIKLTILKSCAPPKVFSPQLALENVTQAAARNGLCWGVAELERLGFPHVIHVHDEILVLCRRERNEALRARDALLSVVGPAGNSPWGWATLIRPDEISVTQSLWESDEDIAPARLDPATGKIVGNDRWGKIERGEPGCLDDLP